MQKFKKTVVIFVISLFGCTLFAQHPSAIVEYESTDKGILIPRLSDTSSVVNPDTGLLIYDNSADAFQYFNGTSWQQLSTSNFENIWQKNMDTIYYQNGPVGIGTQTPQAILEVNEDMIINGHHFGRGAGGSFTNLSLGKDAFQNNSSGISSLSIGVNALKSNINGSYNISIGNNTLFNNTSGRFNVAVGVDALGSNTTGEGNTAIGDLTAFQNTTGYSNVAIGAQALYENTNRSNLVAIGDSALYNNGMGAVQSFEAKANSAIGSKSLFNNTTGYGNTAVGFSSLTDNISGHANTAIGQNALANNTIGGLNTAIGSLSMASNTEGSNNTAVGHNSLRINTTGDINTAMGGASLRDNTTGERNTAVGFIALRDNETGERNTAIGESALTNSISGSQNTAIGSPALTGNAFNGSRNTAVGSYAMTVIRRLDNATGIGYNAQPTDSNTVRIGNISIMEIGGYANWTNVSDARLKHHVQPNIPGLEFIKELRPVSYQLDMDAIASFIGTPDSLRLPIAESQKSAIRYSGFLAQEVEQAAEKIGYDFSGIHRPKHEHDHYGLSYAEFTVPLVRAVQELSDKNEALNAELHAQKMINEKHEHDIHLLKEQLQNVMDQLSTISTK